MNLKEKWSKQNNSVKLLLRKLKRHDTVVVAIAVVIATALCGGLIYISTPVVTANARDEIMQDEMVNNEKTVEKLDELREYLDGIDKTVAENQKNLSSYHEKNSANSKETNELTERMTNNVTEKVVGLDKNMKELRELINNSETLIDELKISMEQGDMENARTQSENMQNLYIELANIESSYTLTQENTRELIREIQNAMESDNKELSKDMMTQYKDLLDKIAETDTRLSQQNTSSLTEYKNEMNDLATEMNNKLAGINSSINSGMENVNKNIDTQMTNVNSNIDKQMGDVNSNIDKHMTGVNNNINEKMTGVNNNIDEKMTGVNNNIDEKIGGVNSNIDKQMTGVNNNIDEKMTGVNNNIDEKMTGVNNNIDEKIGGVNSNIDKQMSGVNSNIDEKMNGVNSNIDEKMTGVNNNIDEKMNGVNNNIDEKIGGVNSNIDKQMSGVNSNIDKQMTNVNSNIDKQMSNVNSNIDKQMGNVTNNINTQMTNVNGNIDGLKSYVKQEVSGVNTKLDSVFTSVSNGKGDMASALLTYGVNVKRDAKFQEFTSAINALGQQKNAADAAIGIMNQAGNLTADKIMAGSSVTRKTTSINGGKYTTQDVVITGTATSDANAVADNISSGKTAYINGKKVTGNGKDVNDAYNKGHDEGVREGKSSALTNVEIVYTIGHTHTGNPNEYGGCYTAEAGSVVVGYELHDCQPTDHYDVDSQYYECVKCGFGFYPAANPQLDPNLGSGACLPLTKTIYTLGCGQEEGQYIRTSDSSDCGQSEKVVSAEVRIHD